MFKRMLLKRVWGEVGRFKNATKKRSAEKVVEKRAKRRSF